MSGEQFGRNRLEERLNLNSPGGEPLRAREPDGVLIGAAPERIKARFPTIKRKLSLGSRSTAACSGRFKYFWIEFIERLRRVGVKKFYRMVFIYFFAEMVRFGFSSVHNSNLDNRVHNCSSSDPLKVYL